MQGLSAESVRTAQRGLSVYGLGLSQQVRLLVTKTKEREYQWQLSLSSLQRDLYHESVARNREKEQYEAAQFKLLTDIKVLQAQLLEEQVDAVNLHREMDRLVVSQNKVSVCGSRSQHPASAEQHPAQRHPAASSPAASRLLHTTAGHHTRRPH
ncbi:hypothetical protein FKM82_006411 [Ascaphus truei]